MLKLTKTTFITGIVLVLPLLFAYLLNLNNFAPLLSYLKQNQIYIIPIALLIKISGLVYPPISGSIVTIAMIPVLGWPLAYLLDLIGNTLGIIITYKLGQKYGETIITKMLGPDAVVKIHKVKIKPDNQIEATIMLRFASLGLSDILVWGASSIGIKIRPFLIGSIIAHLINNMPFYFLISQSINLKSWLIFAPIAVVAVLFLYKIRGRYFE